MSLSAFSSLEAHNGCRALFNHAKGWAYIGPAGPIDSADFPGTVAYEYKGKTPSSATRGGAPPPAPPPQPTRPGDGLGRKINEARLAYLDAADLEHLVHHAERFSCPPCSAVPGDRLEEGGDGDSGGGGGAEGPQEVLRRGRPIVLTLQAILAATTSSPRSPAASPSATADATVGDGEGSAATVISATAGEEGGVGDSGDETVNQPPRVLDYADFPPLRGTQTTTGLLLAPPITMMKRRKTRQPAASGAAAVSTKEAVDREYEDDAGGVSCSEAVAATSVAAAAQSGVGRGVSRVGWWLRWGESGDNRENDVPVAVSTAAPAAAAAAAAASAAAAAAEARHCPLSSSATDSNVVTVGGTDGIYALYETIPGIEGWQVVSGAAGASEASRGGLGERVKPSALQADPPVSAWALVEDNWAGRTGTPSRGITANDLEVEDDAASSWCDCAVSCDVGEVEVVGEEVVETLQGGRGVVIVEVGAGGGEADRDVDPAAAAAAAPLVDVSHDAMYNSGEGVGSDGGAVAAVAVAVALQHAANTSVWDRGEDADPEHPDQQHHRSENVLPTTTGVPQNVPRSFRDMLMTPTATGETWFSQPSKAVVGCGHKTPLLSNGPTLVDGTNGSAVYLWRKAAAGEGGSKAWARNAGREDEDPYYARKRVGAFAFRTKPRGKAHK